MNPPDLRKNPTPYRAAQRVASARITVGRFEQHRAAHYELLRALTSEGQFHLSPFREQELTAYVDRARDLTAFYRAVFDDDALSTHRPSSETEQAMKVHRARVLQTIDHREDDVLRHDIEELRSHWAAARTVSGLAAIPLFLDRIDYELRELAARTPVSPTEIVTAAEQHEAVVQVLTTELRTILLREQTYWHEHVTVSQELRLMLATQGDEGPRNAGTLLAHEQVAFDRLLVLLDKFAIRDNVAIGAPPISRSNAARQGEYLRTLQTLADEAEAVSVLGQAWIARCVGNESRMRRHYGRNVRNEETLILGNADERKTVLFAYAHPDDETTAGREMMAQFHAQGYRVILVTATGGEAGRIQPYELDTPYGHRNFIDLRAQDQEAAAKALGVDVLVRAGFIDSGMKREPSDHRLRLARGNQRALTNVIEQVMRTYQPSMMFTHPPLEQQKSYDHDDHKITFTATEDAFSRYASRFRSNPPRAFAISVEEGDNEADVVFATTPAAQEQVREALLAYRTQIPRSAPALQATEFAPGEMRFRELLPTQVREIALV